MKKIYHNNLITNLFSFFFLLFSLYVSHNLYGKNANYLFVFSISCILVSFFVLYNAVFFILGDIRFAFEIKKRPLALCSYLGSAEMLVGFQNKYLFETTLHYMKEVVVKNDDYISMICFNYIIDYCLYHGITIENKFDKPNVYLEFKFLLLQICNSDKLNHDILAQFRANKIGKRILRQIENSSKLNLKLSSKYSIFKHDIEYKKYIKIVKVKLLKHKEGFKNV